MANYGYPPHLLYLPWGFDPSLLVSPYPFPPYSQGFEGPAGYRWIRGPVMPILPFDFDLAFLSRSFCRAYACFPQPYAYHYPPPQPNDVYLGIPVLPGLPVQPYCYLQPPLQLNVMGWVDEGTGVFHPPHVRDDNTTRARRRRGQLVLLF